MSLSLNDLQAIRKIVKDEVSIVVRSTVKEELAPISGELEALRNDIQEIYDMIAGLQKNPGDDNSFQKLNLEKKILNFMLS